MLNYKTGKLPPNFIYLGYLLMLTGIWRIIVLDLVGVILLLIAVILIFLKFGIMIDTNKKRLKSYISVFSFVKGNWIDISSLKQLTIVKVKTSQNMNVLSISRTESEIVYKLMGVVANKKIELMTSDKDFVLKSAKEISEKLQVDLKQ